MQNQHHQQQSNDGRSNLEKETTAAVVIEQDNGATNTPMRNNALRAIAENARIQMSTQTNAKTRSLTPNNTHGSSECTWNLQKTTQTKERKLRWRPRTTKAHLPSLQTNPDTLSSTQWQNPQVNPLMSSSTKSQQQCLQQNSNLQGTEPALKASQCQRPCNRLHNRQRPAQTLGIAVKADKYKKVARVNCNAPTKPRDKLAIASNASSVDLSILIRVREGTKQRSRNGTCAATPSRNYVPNYWQQCHADSSKSWLTKSG